MSTITADIDVNVPVSTAYEQWTQFESFPEYLSSVDEVTQIDDTLTHWVVSIGGKRREFDARIVDQVPDDHIAWRSVDEVRHAGRVAFHPAEGGSRVELTMEWEPEGFVEKAGEALGIDQLAVKNDLQRFKDFIEDRREPTGAWRGEVHGGVSDPASPSTTRHDSPAPGTPGPRSTDVRGDDPDLLV
ncbi:SRPBCC family protein [Streptomyces sp. AC495_CC817]|uniref:SRPBCC family protein n=1 Tax=Streptomyces sp. AC495_CC817 TaxID=2823900 RepID=UPI001C27A946|nr:SRPBCC family protein [Streptomyces sp. AC495_CC817]